MNQKETSTPNSKKQIIICMNTEQVKISDKVYDYGDRVLKNIETNVHEVFYSGQKQGGKDQMLLDAIEEGCLIKIFYRFKNAKSFTYLGETEKSDIVQYRKINKNIDAKYDELLQIRFILDNIVNEDVPIYFEKGVYTRYKKDIFKYLNYDKKLDYVQGFHIINYSLKGNLTFML